MSTVIDDKYDPLVWGSHLPALLACIGATKGPVLELGVGHFSTPALHALCGAMKRSLISIESNDEWLVQFKPQYSSKQHRLYKSDGNHTDCTVQPHYGVAFIDHSPGGKNRAECFDMLIEHSDYVVVHDYEKDNEEAIAPLLTGIKHHITKTYPPPTLVASMKLPIPESILCL